MFRNLRPLTLRRAAVGGLTALAAVALAASVLPAPAIDRATSRKVQPAAVQLGPLYSITDPKTGEKKYGSFGWGSGSLISADGFILTNAHVTDLESSKKEAADNGAEIVDNIMVVYLTKQADEPPVASYIADIVAVDKTLDVAVIKISTNLNGDKVNSANTSFPWVALGDSDTVELGDTLNIYGYPLIGGETITFTSGPVSGFATDPNYKGRAWIKTSASVSGGNSGGTAVDDDGKLVGIPTREGVQGASGFVDCRPVADTNNDGKLDDKDTCVALGGFINSLRAVNVAKAIVAKATKGKVAKAGTVTTTTTKPTRTTTTTTIPEAVVDDTETLDTEASDVSLEDVFATDAPATAPSTTRARSSGRTTTTTRPPENTEDVAITGYLIDASTGRPIVNGWFFVLQPGVEWSNNISDDQVVAALKTDKNGYFQHPQLRLLRGESYPMGAAADGYEGISSNGVEIPNESDDPIVLTIRLEQK